MGFYFLEIVLLFLLCLGDFKLLIIVVTINIYEKGNLFFRYSKDFTKLLSHVVEVLNEKRALIEY